MALEYTLDIESKLEPAQALKSILASIKTKNCIEPWGKHGAVSNSDPDFVTFAYSLKGEQASLLMENLGIRPNLKFLFRLDKFANIEAAKVKLLQATISLLHQNQKDAALVFNGEKILLARISGQIFINTNAPFWTHSLLAMVDLPYEIRDFAVL